MKTSITFTLIITIAVFSFVSGYSIGSQNKQDASQIMPNQANEISTGTATAAEYTSPASGGYGSSSSENTDSNSAPSPGYGQ